jgi:hypothetical protein
LFAIGIAHVTPARSEDFWKLSEEKMYRARIRKPLRDVSGKLSDKQMYRAQNPSRT